MPHAPSSARLSALAAAQRELSSPGANVDQRVALACERALELTPAIGAAVAWREHGELEFRAARGAARELLGLRVDAQATLPGRCLLTGHTLRGEVNAAESDDAAILHRAGARTRLAAPVQAAGALEVALEIYAGHGAPLSDDDASALELLAGALALSLERVELARLEAAVVALSRTDQLTGLLNRRAGEEAIKRELERAIRYARPLSFVLLEVDHLKLVNDAAGHAGGDRVLRELGRIVGRRLRSIDLGIRFGGEEFLLVAPETDLLGAQDLAEALRTLVEQTSFDVPRPITVSGGVATRHPGERAEQTIARATERLAVAKSAGRNRIVL